MAHGAKHYGLACAALPAASMAMRMHGLLVIAAPAVAAPRTTARPPPIFCPTHEKIAMHAMVSAHARHGVGTLRRGSSAEDDASRLCVIMHELFQILTSFVAYHFPVRAFRSLRLFSISLPRLLGHCL